MVSSSVWNRSELEAELFGALGQMMHDVLAIASLVVVLALIGIFLALGEHRVDQSRELVGRGGDCLCLTHAPEVRTQCRPAGTQRSGG